MDRSDDEDRKSACVRCHSLKLRCIRGVEKADCKRCLRAQAECIVRPSKRVKKTSGTTSSQTGIGPGGSPSHHERGGSHESETRRLSSITMDSPEFGSFHPFSLEDKILQAQAQAHPDGSRVGHSSLEPLQGQNMDFDFNMMGDLGHEFLGSGNPQSATSLSYSDVPDLNAFIASLPRASPSTFLSGKATGVKTGDHLMNEFGPTIHQPLMTSTGRAPDQTAANIWARQLGALNVSLCSHQEIVLEYVQSLSSVSTSNSRGTGSSPSSLSSQASLLHLPIDETFRLAQQLLGLLRDAESRRSPPVPKTRSSSSLSIDTNARATQFPPGQHDLSSNLLILSSYTRLTAISTHVFESLRMVLEQSSTDCSPLIFTTLSGMLPPLNLGPLSETQIAPRLQAALVIDAIELVLRDISRIIGLNMGARPEAGAIGANGGANVLPGVVGDMFGSTFRTLEAEQIAIFERIGEIRRMIMESPCMST